METLLDLISRFPDEEVGTSAAHGAANRKAACKA